MLTLIKDTDIALSTLKKVRSLLVQIEELLKALGYGEDYPKKPNDAPEATVCLFKSKERANHNVPAHN